jgi:ATP-binding cassette subfamily G (WHITE) protein 2 (PDR)
MYRATPLSYFISAIVSTSISGIDITCSASDILVLDAPPNTTCGAYLSSASTRVLNVGATNACKVCPYTSADSLLAYYDIYFEDRWWQWGVTVAYNVINVCLAFGLYWIARVPRGAKRRVKTP